MTTSPPTGSSNANDDLDELTNEELAAQFATAKRAEIIKEIRSLREQRPKARFPDGEATTAAANHSTVKLSIPKFSGLQSDFTMWAKKAALYFRSINLGKVIAAKEDGTPSTPVPITDDDKQSDEHARSILLLNALPDSVVEALGLMNKQTAAECWRALFNAMHPSTKSTVVRALQPFVSTRQQANESVQQYAARTVSAADQLRSIAPPSIITVSDELIALIMLIGLDNSFNGSLNSIYCKKVDIPVTTDEVTSIALEAETRMAHDTKDSITMSANAATAQQSKIDALQNEIKKLKDARKSNRPGGSTCSVPYHRHPGGRRRLLHQASKSTSLH
jgi:hypothetical protein